MEKNTVIEMETGILQGLGVLKIRVPCWGAPIKEDYVYRVYIGIPLFVETIIQKWKLHGRQRTWVIRVPKQH